jgi:transcriptional regulator with XRE-family HTH domain
MKIDGQAVKRARLAKAKRDGQSLSQERLAARIRESGVQVSTATIERIEAIAQVLDVDLDSLFSEGEAVA